MEIANSIKVENAVDGPRQQQRSKSQKSSSKRNVVAAVVNDKQEQPSMVNGNSA